VQLNSKISAKLVAGEIDMISEHWQRKRHFGQNLLDGCCHFFDYERCQQKTK